ncbi:ferredoxin [Dongia sp.]|uniref:ferredoxin n=1 Tax=Dongia sp. TaxID=1977262 RepID=UPI0035AFFB4A
MLAALKDALAAAGMALRGGFAPESGDLVPLLDTGATARTVLLIGNVGGAMWQPFAASGAQDRYAADPMDRWTRDVLDPLAAAFGAKPLYPSDGPPYHPFQRWAARAEAVHVSPLRIFIHPAYGLWHAYRAAFLVAEALRLPAPAFADSPCLTCADRPCLSSCPVGAFTENGLDDLRCARHVDGPGGAECRDNGCLARRACPVGRGHAYPPQQMAFHMEAFLARRR